MNAQRLKSYLLELADKVDSKTTLEDIYHHIALLHEIDQAENEARMGIVLPNSEVKCLAKEWLK